MAATNEVVVEQKEEPRITSAFWFEEEQTPNLKTMTTMTKLMLDTKSEFQRVQLIETGQFGMVLVLDGKTQSAATDEYIYHESLVHPAMLLHPEPKTVYIGGGGELATAREVLRHKSVEKCVMVDLDKKVVDVAIEHMQQWTAGCQDDPRLDLHYDDAKAFLETYDGKFDVIIMDIADPIEAGPGYLLYTEEFYKFATSKLNPGGVLVTQSGPGSTYNHRECFTAIHRTLRQAFTHVLPYTVDIPSFGSNWGFNLAFGGARQGGAPGAEERESVQGEEEAAFVGKDPAAINAAIAERITGELAYYDGFTHRSVFNLTKPMRAAFAAEERVITVDDPVFMY